ERRHLEPLGDSATPAEVDDRDVDGPSLEERLVGVVPGAETLADRDPCTRACAPGAEGLTVIGANRVLDPGGRESLQLTEDAFGALRRPERVQLDVQLEAVADGIPDCVEHSETEAEISGLRAAALFCSEVEGPHLHAGEAFVAQLQGEPSGLIEEP